MSEILLFNLLEEMEFSDKARGLSDRTLKKNKKFLTHFFLFIKEKYHVEYLNEVNKNIIQAFMIYKKEQGNAETYINSYLRSIRAFFKYCEDEGYITQVANPCLRVKWMKEEKIIKRTFTDEDIKKMLVYADKKTHSKLKKYDSKRTGHLTRFINERNKFLIMLLADSGLRINEVHNLTDATLTQQGIHVIRGKGKKGRFIFASPLILKEKMKYDRAKQRYFDSVDYNVKKHVFVTRKGNKYSVDMMERDVKRIAVHAGVRQEVRASPHTFRHYFTQSLVRYGTDIYTIQRLIGHSSIKTTEVYLNSLVDEVVIKKDYPQVH